MSQESIEYSSIDLEIIEFHEEQTYTETEFEEIDEIIEQYYANGNIYCYVLYSYIFLFFFYSTFLNVQCCKN